MFPQGQIWEFFRMICAVPHPSGHEAELAEALAAWAEAQNLVVRRFAAGNLTIYRPPTPGFEGAPHVILQAHLDMVPQSADGTFDFLSDPIRVESDGEYLHTDGRTTLGADNGIGVAMALAALADPRGGGALTALFTVEEETGLTGAAAVTAAELEAEYLINLDSEDQGIIFVGCAGGGSVRGTLACPLEPTAGTAYKLTLHGLHGGHSGMEIGKNRGNAIGILAEILREQPGVRLAEFSGGTLSNVIPSAATALIVGVETVAAEPILAKWRNILGANGDNLTLRIEPACAQAACTAADSAQILRAMALADGVISFDHRWNIPEASSNLATAELADGGFTLLASQRAQDDTLRRELTAKLSAHLEACRLAVEVREAYCGWNPRSDSALLELARQTYRELDVEPKVEVVHAGLECGIFAAVNPNCDMISLGPDIELVHSVEERVSIASVEFMVEYLHKLLEKIYSRQK